MSQIGPVPARRPKRSPLVVAAFIGAILLLAFVASRTLQRNGQKVNQDEAVALAEKAAGIDADQEVVRFVRSGVQGRSHWAVSLSELQPDGRMKLQATLLIDATNGQVVQITRAP